MSVCVFLCLPAHALAQVDNYIYVCVIELWPKHVLRPSRIRVQVVVQLHICLCASLSLYLVCQCVNVFVILCCCLELLANAIADDLTLVRAFNELQREEISHNLFPSATRK